MPYGPGKFEGEPASTFILYQSLLEFGADENSGSCALFKGPFFPEINRIRAAKQAGYTMEEINTAIKVLNEMYGAILHENDQGFVSAKIYNDKESESPAPNLDEDWQQILDSKEEE